MSNQFAASPIVRIVQGSVWTGSTKGYQGAQLTDKTGAPKTQWFVGAACPKGPEFDAFWAQVSTKAQLDFPAGEWQMPAFAWKITDGDDPKQVSKEGRAGHWILKLTSGFAPEVYNSDYVQLLDPSMVTPGDYVRINVGVQGNGEPANGKPGIYLNLGTVLLIQKGVPIVSGPSPQEIFGAPTPVAAAPGQLPAVTPTPVPAAHPLAPPAPAAAAPYQPPAGPAVAPATPGMPGQLPAAVPAPAAPGAAHPLAPATAMPGDARPAAATPGFLTPGVPQR